MAGMVCNAAYRINEREEIYRKRGKKSVEGEIAEERESRERVREDRVGKQRQTGRADGV